MYNVTKKEEKDNAIKNKPAAQAAGADPSQCNSTNRQNSPLQLNCCNFLINNEIFMSFDIYNVKPMQHNQFNNWWPYVLLFRRGGSLNSAEEEDDLPGVNGI